MKSVIILGAGFSKNFGFPLASEQFEEINCFAQNKGSVNVLDMDLKTRLKEFNNYLKIIFLLYN